MSSSRTSILREIAELSNPRHVDYDPEDIAPDYQDSDNDTDEQAATSGREHYVQVRYFSQMTLASLRTFAETK